MVQAIGGQIEDMWDIISCQRSDYNELAGIQIVKRYGINQSGMDLVSSLDQKYYALTAISALFSKLEESKIELKSNSLNFKFQSLKGTMMIDFITAQDLELVSSLINNQSKQSLFGLLDHTSTKMGARFLRSSILQPLLDEKVICSRHDAINELMETENCLESLNDEIKAFPDLDHLIASIIQIPNSNSKKGFAEQSINHVLVFKQVLIQSMKLSECLKTSKSFLLNDICNTLNHSTLPDLLYKVNLVVNEDVLLQTSSLGLRNQRCYAIKSGFNGLLDVARQTYKEATDDIHDLIAEYSDFKPIKLQFSAGIGFFMALSLEELGVDRMPEHFVNIVKKGKSIHFSSLKMISLNEKIMESLNEVMIMSEVHIVELLVSIHENLPIIYLLSEALGMLDFLMALAVYGKSKDTCFPEFSSSTLAVKNGRHPILEMGKNQYVVSNDIYADPSIRMQFITGQNMSGKSIYLSQIALLQILSQIGSPVPAEFASIKIVDKMLTRIGNDDGNSAQISSFTQEMKAVAFVLDQISENSLVIFDELGRGTSNTDAIAISVAVVEAVIETKAFCFFATHFLPVCRSFESNSSVATLKLSPPNATTPNAKETHKISKGINMMENYGIELSKTVGFPTELILEAKKLSLHLKMCWQERERKADEFQKVKVIKVALPIYVDGLESCKRVSLKHFKRRATPHAFDRDATRDAKILCRIILKFFNWRCAIYPS